MYYLRAYTPLTQLNRNLGFLKLDSEYKPEITKYMYQLLR